MLNFGAVMIQSVSTSSELFSITFIMCQEVQIFDEFIKV